jgi:hypothetical protein
LNFLAVFVVEGEELDAQPHAFFEIADAGYGYDPVAIGKFEADDHSRSGANLLFGVDEQSAEANVGEAATHA